MNVHQQLIERSGGKCELTGTRDDLQVYPVFPKSIKNADDCIYISASCIDQITQKSQMEEILIRSLKDTIWSEIPALQVLSWRMLHRLRNEAWAAELLEMVYLEEDRMEWAKASDDHLELNEEDIYKDSNGAVLQQGDSVVLIKSLDVKGSSITARIGTVIKNIKLVAGNNGQIEGKIDGQQIVVLTKFVKKQ